MEKRTENSQKIVYEASPRRDDYFGARGLNSQIYSTEPLSNIYKSILPKNQTARILDYGCGQGVFLMQLQNAGYTNIFGADILKPRVNELNERGLQVTMTDGSPEDISKLPKGFDLIVLSHVLEHFPKNHILPALTALRSLLSPTGKLFVAVPNAQSATGPYWAYEDYTHSTLFTAGSLLHYLELAGFHRVELIDPYGIMNLPFWKKRVRLFLRSIFLLKTHLWNLATDSHFHRPSPQIFTYDIKALASQDHPS